MGYGYYFHLSGGTIMQPAVHDLRDDVRATRMARGLSQAAVAEAIGVSQQTVARWEQGKGGPPQPRQLEGIRRFLENRPTRAPLRLATPDDAPALLPVQEQVIRDWSARAAANGSFDPTTLVAMRASYAAAGIPWPEVDR